MDHIVQMILHRKMTKSKSDYFIFQGDHEEACIETFLQNFFNECYLNVLYTISFNRCPKGAFYLSELTGQPIPIVMRIQISQILNIMQKGDGFSAKPVGKKPISLPKCLVGVAMARPASSDFWKAPLVFPNEF